MKINTNEHKVFRPITILVETPGEAAILASLFGNISPKTRLDLAEKYVKQQPLFAQISSNDNLAFGELYEFLVKDIKQ